MKKIFMIVMLLVMMISLAGCESRGPRGNVRLGDDLVPDYTLTTMPPHSYAEFSGTYLESLISAGDSYYESLYESMYPTETDKWGGMQTVTGISAQKIEAVTTAPFDKLSPDTSVCVRNPSDEEFERLLSEAITTTTTAVTSVTDDETTLETTDVTTTTATKTKMIAVTADTAAARTSAAKTVSNDTE